MGKRRLFLILWLLFIGMLTMPPTLAQEPTYRIIGYYTSWSIYARKYFVTDIPADKLTHINYAFANVSEKGECIVGDEWADTQYPYPDDPPNAPFLGNFHQLNALKEEYPHLKTLISVGGWTWSDHFSDAALTAESRAKFARSCVALMKQYGFDGLDVDWEYPVSVGANPELGRPEDTENFTLLLADLRAQLDAQGEQDGRVHYLLTIAAPAGPYHYSDFQLGQIHPYLDWINVMAYDFHGGWETTTNFNAPLYAASDDSNPDDASLNADAAMQAYLAVGIPAEKLVLGVPFYGRGWSGVPDIHGGLFQLATGVPDGTWEPGAFDYNDLEANYLPTSARYWHDEAGVPWLYNADRQLMISYDDPESLRIKAAYVRSESLGGIMFWELSGDTGAHTLLNALYEQLTECVQGVDGC
ncbi:MAG TPA: glycoside hydrolase family 18 protein [Aggregatilineaceae bacterium]|nr:glycoside hydrolase family 18 protein [Aggregatilineaceae bacterium]